MKRKFVSPKISPPGMMRPNLPWVKFRLLVENESMVFHSAPSRRNVLTVAGEISIWML